MNKIINANIHGFVFNIDELAYDKLKNYLETIRDRVKNAEVMTDIENRIAELFDYRLRNGAQAIFDRDVEDIMQQIGSPEQFGQEEGESNPNDKAETNYSHRERKQFRRLYRNEDDKIIGGVCSGIAAYFDIDPIFLRIGFALSLFMFGTGVLLYIFLMIILPKAVTPAEKLEMMGERVDFNNLSKTIEKDIKDAYNRYKPEMKTGFQRFVEIMAKVAAIMLIVILISVFIPLSIGLFTSVGVASWFLPLLSSYIFMTPNEGILILLGLILFFLIPVIGAAYKLIRIAFKINPMNKIVSVVLSVFWFLGFCLLAFSTYNVGKEFAGTSVIKQTDTIQKQGGTFVIRAKNTQDNQRFIISNGGDNEHFSIHSREDMKEFIDDKIGRNIEMKIVRGYGSKPVIQIIKRSNGRSNRMASTFADRIQYEYELSDSSILLNDYFTLGNYSLWRNQRVRIIIEMPKSAEFYIDGSCSSIMNDRHFDDFDNWDEGSIFNKRLHLNDNGLIVN